MKNDEIPLVVSCSGCGRDVPNGSIYCPYCCSKEGRQAAIMRGALIGGLLGLLVGGLLAGLWSIILGPDRATWGRAFGVVVTCFTTGLMWGMIRRGRN